MWAGSRFAHLIEFSTGLPAGAIFFELRAHDSQTILTSGNLTPERGSMSALLVIEREHNSCDLPLFENRTLSWEYVTNSGLVSNQITYRVDRPLPLAAAPEGVRNRLGVTHVEVPDTAVDMVSAYARLLELVSVEIVTSAAALGDATSLHCIAAVEALAALALLPTLQLRAAQTESNGTQQMARFSTIDWGRVELDLLTTLARARVALDSAFDAYGTNAVAFQVAPRDTDAVTNETN